MTLLVSAQEPPELRKLGVFSALCEQHGADFIILTASGELAGCQRKEIHDLVSSLGERLNRELMKMAPLDIRILLVEGEFRWTAAGESLSLGGYNTRFTRKSYNGLMLAVQQLGIWVVTTDNISHTAEWLVQAETWLDKRDHVSLSTRPKPPRDMFGDRDSAGWRLHWYQGFAGIGVISAKALDEEFNGQLPFAFTMSREEWMTRATKAVGVGRKRAETMWFALMGKGAGESMGEKT